MAAPSGTVWGSIVSTDYTHKGRMGIYTNVTTSGNQVTANVQVWFWTMYSCEDKNNVFYYDHGANITQALTNRGTVSIVTTVDTGEGWSTSNQVKIYEQTYTYTASSTAKTYNVYTILSNIDYLNDRGTYYPIYANSSYTVPAISSYTVSYNANGGSGAPAAQTKWSNQTLKLSTSKPTRSGYAFQGWATSASGSVAYAAGANYTANASVTLYAVWKANTYTVSYHANGGSGAPAAQTKTHGVNLTLSGTVPTRTNYTFKGWGTSSSATSVAYNPGGTYTSNASITLYAVWTQSYTNPRITNISTARCNSGGTTTDSGTYARVQFSWACDKSVSSIVIEALSGTSVVTSKTVSASGTSGTVNTTFGGSLSTDATYTIRITVTDSGGSTRKSETLSGLKFAVDFKAGGKGVSFGKPAELVGYADFGWNAHFDNYLGIYGRDLDGNIKLALQPQNENGNTVLGWGNYENKAGNTNLYGYDVICGVSNIASPTTFRPYRRRGDTLTFTLRTAGYVTNGGADVSFFVPFAVPIIGSPTVTVSSVNGFTLRQDNKYTHGSSATTYAFPSSYTATVMQWGGVYVTAHFSDTTNVTNNDSIGIYWNGSITFS